MIAPQENTSCTWQGRKSLRIETLPIFCWSVIAGLSLARGVANSLRPAQSQDLKVVYTWVWEWLRQAANPYAMPNLEANYPPHAIVFLSPLLLVPRDWIPEVWSAFNLLLAPCVAILAVRLVNPDARRDVVLLFTAMFLSWAGLRIGLGNGQLSLLTMALGLLAVAICDKSPVAAGVALGLSLMKPHVGGAFLLWSFCTRRFRTAVVAIGVTLLGFVVFSTRLGENPGVVLGTFLSVLGGQFSGPFFLQGAVEVRPLVHLLISDFVLAEAAHLAFLVVTLGAVGVASARLSRLSMEQRDAGILQLSCVWALMVMFHNSYDMILLLPVVAGLCAARGNPPSGPWLCRDRWALWLLQLALVVEIPGTWWKWMVKTQRNVSGYEWLGQMLLHFDRVLVLTLFLYLLLRIRTSGARWADATRRGRA